MDGLELKEKRRLYNIEQTQLAEGLGLNPHTISRWERGDAKILKKHWGNIDKFFKNFGYDNQTRYCKECGKDISHMHTSAIYCSKVCRNKKQDRKKHKPMDEYLKEMARQRLITTLNKLIEYKNNVKVKKCRECGKEFETVKEDLYYCSDECKDTMKERVVEIKKLSKLFIKECSECGKRFPTLHPNTITCSKECSKKRKHRWGRLYKSLRLNNRNTIDKHIPLKRVYERDNGICYLCGEKCDWEDYTLTEEGHFISGEKYPSRDHVIPIALGGMHSWDNIKLACHRCNALKRDIPLDEYKVSVSM